MAGSRVKIGLLIPLQKNLLVDYSVSNIPIFQGRNIIGRNNLAISDKRVSRKHVSLHTTVDGSAEVVVEGPNPVIVKSGDERKKLSTQDKAPFVHGDILELIPGNYLFKYVTVGNEDASSSKIDSSFLRKEKRHSEEESSAVKRNRHILEDESLEKTLQENDNLEQDDVVAIAPTDSQWKPPEVLASCENVEAIRHFCVPKDRLSLIFRLMRVQGLPAWTNSCSVAIQDVIQGNVLIAVLSNYMVDIDWLMSACPDLRKIPHVLVIHGESGATIDRLKKNRPANWILHKPPLPISYGTHHSKAMLLVYPQGVRVVVHTANLIYVDWNNKTQGLWMQDFPWKEQQNLNKGSSFENDLVDYLNTLKWSEFNVNLPVVGNVNINPSFFKKFDYSSSKVRLIASVPGYHKGTNLKKWGHMKLRGVLEECIFDKEFCKSPLVYQFSSLGSLDERWLAELAVSMSSGILNDGSPLGSGKPLIIWPTVEDVRCSLEGYAAGNAIPSPQKNVEKDFLKKYWARWKANHVGRCRAMPHIKTYTRYNGQNLAWFLLTSANLSKAAWGALQKNSSQLMIRSYELGVLFLPSTIQDRGSEFSCTENLILNQGECKSFSDTEVCKTKLVTLCRKGNNGIDSSSEVIRLPVPYQLPPQPYTSEDIPWSWDRQYFEKDVYGQVWPHHVELYANEDA
ncbi:tyrosyl-DNA phosphodiesterase 1 isoform X2 [Phoenix dactylifera]|uniref:Tyrosyl-DNA phosphodiesterase 1 isoform X2 n=1 Tax=Phoenix dactylifera TaxID=42345 RepID=A0A8B9A5D9_PHODC|nr:tyrosyl-DNA phosphodiesterase 1 isoform X2 [Phoenix dactylifera]